VEFGQCQNPLIVKQYRQKIYEKFLQKKQQADINQEWENIKSVILESAEETIKTREKNIRNERWDEECKVAISRKSILRKKCLQKRTKSNLRTIQASEKRS
jgi:23S rRNA maturation mini-RNase III